MGKPLSKKVPSPDKGLQRQTDVVVSMFACPRCLLLGSIIPVREKVTVQIEAGE